MPSSDQPPIPRTAVPGLAQDLLAGLLSQKGRTSEAVAHRRAALEKLEQVLGPDHEELQPSLAQLAREFLALGDFSAAASVLRRTYQHRISRLGPEHPDTREHLALLSECLMNSDQPAAAKPLLEQQIALAEHLLGSNHEETLTAVQLLAVANSKLGDMASAGGLLRQAYEGFDRSLGSDHPKTLACLYALFENLSEGSNPAIANSYGEKLSTTSQRVNGPTHLLTISAAALVANHYIKQQDFTAAVGVSRLALDAYTASSSAPDLGKGLLHCRLAACLDLSGEIDEAHRMARLAFQTLQAVVGPDHAESQRALRLWVDISRRRQLRTPWGRFLLRCVALLQQMLPRQRH